jgi:DNA-binding transcriptional LysR family regulator
MELHQLAYVVAVAEEGSFTRAAAREHVAQPGVSAQVRKLEAELGHSLFERGAGPVRPTAAGEVILPFARAALAAASGVRTAVDELTGLLRGQVSIGVIPWVGQWFLTALADFHRRHPDVEIRLIEAASMELLGGVRSGGLDLALAGLATTTPAGLESVIVTEQELVAAVPEDHRLGRRRAIGIEDLAEWPLIALPAHTGGRTALEAGFARAGHRPRVAFEAGDPRVLMQLAAQGLGVAIVPASAPDELHVIRITPRMRSRLELVWRADATPSPAADAFIGEARTALAARPSVPRLRAR